MIPEATFLAPYLMTEQRKHKYHKESCEYAEKMLIHYDGRKPGKLLTERRPAESKEIHEFRMLIFESKTRAFCDKITNSLMKIRKSQDWMIKYPANTPEKIASDQTLKFYMEKNFPRYASFTNWYFQIGFKMYQTDSNALCLWKPRNEDLKDNEYYKPYPFLFKSNQVIDYRYEEWYFLLSAEKNHFIEDGQSREGWIYYYVDAEGIYTIKQVTMAGGYIVDEFKHGLGYIPIVDFGGIVQDETRYQCLRQSRMFGIVPSFNEAVREYSDLQAEVIQHIHSTMWAHEGQDCKKCKGTGYIPKKNAEPIECKSCKGKGTVPFNPYEYYSIPRPKVGETQITGVPIGYVTKQIEIAELQNTRIKDHIRDGLSSINMEFLIDPPQLVESGTAKEVDRDDMNTFFHAVAEDIIRFFDTSYRISCDYRYSGIITNSENRMMLLPNIPVPEKYDILSETYLAREIRVLKETGINVGIINLAQEEYARKKFFADHEAIQMVSNELALDPFASVNEDIIITQLTNNGIEEIDYIIHCNIHQFVSRAIDEDDKFITMDLSDRKDVMRRYAKEILKANSAKEKLLSARPEFQMQKVVD